MYVCATKQKEKVDSSDHVLTIVMMMVMVGEVVVEWRWLAVARKQRSYFFFAGAGTPIWCIEAQDAPFWKRKSFIFLFFLKKEKIYEQLA